MAGDREARVRARAHELWEKEGRPADHEKRHWDQASAEIDEEVANSASGKAAGPRKRAAKKAVAVGSKPARKGAKAPDAPKRRRGKKAES